MKRRPTIRSRWAAPILIVLATAGCGGPPADSGPVEEPNTGPGGPPGLGKISFDPSAKPAAKGASKPAEKADAKAGAAPGKSAPGK